MLYGSRHRRALALAGGRVQRSGPDGPASATEQSIWSFATGAVVPSSPAVANGAVYIGSFDFKLYAFDPAGGTAAVQRPAAWQLHPNYSLQPQENGTVLTHR